MSEYCHSGEAELLPLTRMWASSDQGPPGVGIIVKWFADLMWQGVSFPPITVG